MGRLPGQASWAGFLGVRYTIWVWDEWSRRWCSPSCPTVCVGRARLSFIRWIGEDAERFERKKKSRRSVQDFDTPLFEVKEKERTNAEYIRRRRAVAIENGRRYDAPDAATDANPREIRSAYRTTKGGAREPQPDERDARSSPRTHNFLAEEPQGCTRSNEGNDRGAKNLARVSFGPPSLIWQGGRRRREDAVSRVMLVADAEGLTKHKNDESTRLKLCFIVCDICCMQ